jgi:rare lipoprotein A (peptidoglycan hydrolase)
MPRPAPRAGALLTLTAVAAGLLLTASGSQALSALRARTSKTTSFARRHRGFRRGVASWYYDDHHRTACGFHAKFGVANRRLRCGKHVTFLHHGHRVKAIVDDRGPYIAGRTWDLDEHTRHALHLRGVEKVWAKW